VARAGGRLIRRAHRWPRARGDRFDRFTTEARTALRCAHDEAASLGHSWIGTEHLLLGLVREEHGVAARVLAGFGIQDVGPLRASLAWTSDERAASPPDAGAHIGLTPKAKRVIEASVDEARRLHHDYIGTEHLLLGLVRDGDGTAVALLQARGLAPDQLRRRVHEVLEQSA
jgi:ATP-dependent Clp protease ATP-binding subunit ClpC